MQVTRRDFLKLGAAAGVAGAVGCGSAQAQTFKTGGQGYSAATGKEMKAIPSACWQCVARDGIIGYVEDGRLKKIEGNPKLPRTGGKICSKGQAGVNQVYDPDRVLYPLKQTKTRGDLSGFVRISWEQALNELAVRLKKIRDEGTPEKFAFHYGRMKASSSKIIKTYFLGAYGTKSIGNHTAICEGGKWTTQELTWGKHYDINDITHSDFILNFGCNVMNAHTSHVPFAQRVAAAIGRGVPIVTFDVRLSNTAAKSREWIPVKPGTDLAVMLAMSNVICQEGLARSGKNDFLEKFTNVTYDEISNHLKQYTPEWAEGISSVPAATIKRLAIEFGRANQATVITYRGVAAHHNNVQGERAAFLLEALCGFLNKKGGRLKAVGAKWDYKYDFKFPKAKKVDIWDGDKSEDKKLAYPTHHSSHQVLKMLKKAGPGTIDTYMTYCYNPAYVNGEVQENIDILKNENLIPYLVAVDVAMSETAMLADLILPDTTYIERWDWEDMVSYDQIPEYYIRQPLVAPLGHCRDFKDVCCELSGMIGDDMKLPFSTAREFVQHACEKTADVKAAGGFDYMVKHGALVPKGAKPKYESHAQEVPASKLEHATFDEATGVYWDPHKAHVSEEDVKAKGYTGSKKAYKGYIGQKIGDKVYVGFPPDKVNKSGFLELKSGFLAKAGYDAMPSWMEIPGHKAVTGNDNKLILTTFKAANQTHSRTQNCKWLTELYHTNPAWLNTRTAQRLGIKDGDTVKLTSSVGSKNFKVRVGEDVHPTVIAISNHCGHWAYGRYAMAQKEAGPGPYSDREDPETDRIWWTDNGDHPNWIIPNKPDPIAGQLCFMDTVVTVQKA